jgi:predicted enzyme related to lactoylglutathione lyase
MRRIELVLDCADPERLAGFWSEALGYRRRGAAGQYVALSPPEGEDGPPLILQGVAEGKSAKNRLHIDVLAEDIEAEAERLVALGATRPRADTIEEHGHRWILLADPEGNELCVCEG